MSFCVVPRSSRRRCALLLGVGDVQRQQPRGRGVDRHRRVHLPGRDAVEQRAQVAEVGDRHADLADLATCHQASPGRSRSGSGRSKAIDRPVWPFARFVRYSSFDAAAVEWPGVGAHQPRLISPCSWSHVQVPSRCSASRELVEVLVAGDRTAPREARCDVIHCTSSSRPSVLVEPVDERDEGDLRRVGGGVEHRLPGEQAIDAHAVEPADQLAVVVEALDGVGPTEPVQALVRLDEAGGDPPPGRRGSPQRTITSAKRSSWRTSKRRMLRRSERLTRRPSRGMMARGSGENQATWRRPYGIGNRPRR